MDILRRAAAADPGVPANAKGTALIADPNKCRADATALLLRGLGYNVEVFTTGRDLLRRVARASDFDVILIDHHTPNPELIDLIGATPARTRRPANRPTFVVASTDKPRVPTFDQLLVRFAAPDRGDRERGRADARRRSSPTRGCTPEENAVEPAAEPGEPRRRVPHHRRPSGSPGCKRVIDATGLDLTETQRLLLDLRIELITYAVLGAEFPISPRVGPGTADHLTKLRRQIDLQPPSPPYGAGTPTTDLLKLMERFEIDLAKRPRGAEAVRGPVLEGRRGRTRAAGREVPRPGAGGPAREDSAELPGRARSSPSRTAARPRGRPEGGAGRTRRRPARPGREEGRAAGWRSSGCAKMATGEVTGFDVKLAEPELRAALRVDDLADARHRRRRPLPVGRRPAGLLELALNTGKPLPLRIEGRRRGHPARAGEREGHRQVADRPAGEAADKEPDPTLRAQVSYPRAECSSRSRR